MIKFSLPPSLSLPFPAGRKISGTDVSALESIGAACQEKTPYFGTFCRKDLNFCK
jgi:hypothetical protein